MAFTNDDKQEIRDIVIEVIDEQTDAIEDCLEVQALAEGDELPLVRESGNTKSYHRADVSLFGGGGGTGDVSGIKVGDSGDVLTPTSGIVTIPSYETGAEKNPGVFGSSGPNHSTGLVPDPGSSAGQTRYLREDGSWQVPAGGGGGTGTVTGAKVGSGSIISPDANGIVNLPNYETDAQKNVKPNWNAVAGSDAEILNKPTIPAEQIQSDWTQTDTTKKDYIKNKPTIPAGVEPSTTTPKEDTTNGVVGTEVKFARGDHRHPHDTTKADKSEMAITPGTGENSDKTTIQLKDGMSTTVLTQHQDITGKVDKVNGKGLSSNDYTTDEKNKLNGIETGAEKHKAPTSQEVKNALGTGSGTTKYLREDGTWQTPPNSNTTYSLGVGTGDDANKVVLTPSSGNADKITVPYASNAGTVNGKTVAENVPSGAKFTDTTYKFTIGTTTKGDSTNGTDLGTLKSETAAASGTTLSLVTTGEKATWNGKQDALSFNQTPSSSNKVATMADIPSSLPANGGNAATVNNHSVAVDVPSDAKFTDTTYSVMGASGASHASGLVPDPGATQGNSKFLREDGTWATPSGGSTIQSDTEPKLDSTNYVTSDGLAKNKGLCKIRNGSIGNPANGYCVCTWFVPLGEEQYAWLETDRPNTSGCKYSLHACGIYSTDYIYTTNTPPSGNNEYIDYDRYSFYEYFDLSEWKEKGVVAFAIGIVEVNTTTFEYNALRIGDFDGYSVRIATGGEHDRILTGMDAMTSMVNGSYSVKLRNGSTGNIGNTNAVTTFTFPTYLFKYFKVTITRPNTSGYHYEFTWDGCDTPYGAVGAGYQVSKRTEWYDTYRQTNNVVYKMNPQTRGMAVAIWEVNEARSAYHALRVSDFNGYDVIIRGSGLFNAGMSPVVERNADKRPLLSGLCRYRKDGELTKDFQLLIISDSHDDGTAVRNAVDAANGFETIDALIHCGDAGDCIELTEDVSYKWKDIVADCMKPFFFVIGNHESGNYSDVLTWPSDQKLYDDFIKPSVDAGWLKQGEYTSGKCYYYHDFSERKIRLVSLYEFEAPKVFDTTYWTPITYSSSYSNVKYNTSYSSGDKVNVGGYTSYSFQAVQNVNTGSFRGPSKAPRYKYASYRWISQQQAQWFLNTLLSTPSNYKVIVATHIPFSNYAESVAESKFTQLSVVRGDGMNYMTNDFIADALNAFKNGTNFSTTCSSLYPSDMTSYTVSANFANKNSGVTFHSLVGGHTHRDLLWKHQNYNLYQIGVVSANSNYPAQTDYSDIRKSDFDGYDKDCLTVASYGDTELRLAKIGINVTENGRKRDYEIVDINTGKFIRYNSNGEKYIQIKTGSITGTTSGNGNLKCEVGKKVVILSAWSSTSSTIVLPYAAGVSGSYDFSTGQTIWWFHCSSDSASQPALANTSLTVYYTYIELE